MTSNNLKFNIVEEICDPQVFLDAAERVEEENCFACWAIQGWYLVDYNRDGIKDLNRPNNNRKERDFFMNIFAPQKEDTLDYGRRAFFSGANSNITKEWRVLALCFAACMCDNFWELE